MKRSEIYAFLLFYPAQIGSLLPTFQSYLSVSSWRIKESTGTAWPLKLGQIGVYELSITNYQSTLDKIPEERIFYLHRGGSLKSRK